MIPRNVPGLTPCGFPMCPALTSAQYCPVHLAARRAHELRLSADFSGRGAARCITCRKPFGPNDWVDRVPRQKLYRTAPGQPKTGYAHMTCEPAPAKRRKAAPDTPLFEGTD